MRRGARSLAPYLREDFRSLPAPPGSHDARRPAHARNGRGRGAPGATVVPTTRASSRSSKCADEPPARCSRASGEGLVTLRFRAAVNATGPWVDASDCSRIRWHVRPCGSRRASTRCFRRPRAGGPHSPCGTRGGARRRAVAGRPPARSDGRTVRGRPRRRPSRASRRRRSCSRPAAAPARGGPGARSSPLRLRRAACPAARERPDVPRAAQSRDHRRPGRLGLGGRREADDPQADRGGRPPTSCRPRSARACSARASGR